MKIQISGEDFVAFVEADSNEEAYFKLKNGLDSEDVKYHEVEKK